MGPAFAGMTPNFFRAATIAIFSRPSWYSTIARDRPGPCVAIREAGEGDDGETRIG